MIFPLFPSVILGTVNVPVKFVNPDTFNELLIDVLLFNVVEPETFKVDWPDTFNDDDNVDEPDINKLLKSVLLFKLLIDDNTDVVNVENVVVQHKLMDQYITLETKYIDHTI